jgi:hypothetical protein
MFKPGRFHKMETFVKGTHFPQRQTFSKAHTVKKLAENLSR